MIYRQLDQDYKDLRVAEMLYQREVEHFNYSLEYEHISAAVGTMPENNIKQSYIQRLGDLTKRMAEVDSLHGALQATVTDQIRFQAAVAKLAAKRAAAESETTKV